MKTLTLKAATRDDLVALHLEVEGNNTAGNNLYTKMGYGFNNRKLLTKML